MKIKEFITSGILESYVLGELSAEDGDIVLAMARQHPEIKAELEKIELGFETMAQNTKIAPDAKLKEKLWSKLVEEEKKEIKLPSVASDGKNVKTNYFQFVAAAAVVIAIITSYLAYDYYQKWQNTAQQLTVLTNQQAQVAEDYRQVSLKLESIEEDLSIINDNSFSRIALNGTDNAPSAQSTVYWNQKSSELYLSVQTLSDVTNDYQFQLWAIIDGEPVDAGLIPADFNGLVTMKTIQGAQAFAITIEKRGGSKSPSLETMQVYGEVG